MGATNEYEFLVSRIVFRVTYIAVWLIPILPSTLVFGQDSNLFVATGLAVECASPLTTDLSSFAYRIESSIGALETGIVDRWLAEGKVVSRHDDSSAGNSLDYIVLNITHMAVTYRSAEGRTLERTVEVRLSGLSFSGKEATDSVADCPGQLVDTIPSAAVRQLEDSSIPETIGTVPTRGFLRRYVQPIVIGAASAATVYLLFSVRSDQAGS